MVLIKLDSSTLLNQNSSDFTVNYNNFELDIKKKYELAMVRANIWYSWYNIASEFNNNIFKYSIDSGINYINIVITDGIYSVSQLNNFIQQEMKKNNHYDNINEKYYITLIPNYSTLKLDIEITNISYYIDFNQGDLNELLGFDKIIITQNESGGNTVDITRGVNSISIHCSIIEGSYENSIASDVLYSFSPNLSSGSLLTIEPINRIYLPLNVSSNIYNINMRLTDQQNRPINLNGENVVYLLHLREQKY